MVIVTFDKAVICANLLLAFCSSGIADSRQILGQSLLDALQGAALSLCERKFEGLKKGGHNGKSFFRECGMSLGALVVDFGLGSVNRFQPARIGGPYPFIW